MKLKLYLLLMLLVSSGTFHASHIVGGDIYYDYLGSNQYKFSLTIYRDCASNGAPFDDPLFLAVYPNNSSTPLKEVSIPFKGSVILPISFNNPCGTAPTGLCVEKTVYTTVITLPPTIGGYHVTYQRCCRGPEISNLISPDNTGFTLTAHIPGFETGAYANSSPRFTNYPPLLLCAKDPLVFNHIATDPDGDVLVYSLVTPYEGADVITPMPKPVPPPPYYPVIWRNGFNASQPLGLSANTQIDSKTGLLTATPKQLGLFVVGVRVQEYRNGKLIGETIRDFLFKVLDCNITLSANLPKQEELTTFKSYCQGLTVHFENNSFGGSVYKWDFGVEGTSTDVSNQAQPTFTYPSPGTYQATLVVNPGEKCTDTAYIKVRVNNEFTVDFKTIDSLCFKGNVFDFYSQTNGINAESYLWDFGPNASVSKATTQTVNGVQFSVSGSIPITLNAVNGECKTSYTAPIYIFPEINTSILLPEGYECNGLTLPFGNSSTGGIKCLWDFGVSGILTDTSTQFYPTYTFPKGGSYDVMLIGSVGGKCFDTSKTTVNVNELLAISFKNNDSLCLTNNKFWFDGTITGPDFTKCLWEFGSFATPKTSNMPDVVNVIFDSAGVHNVKLTAWFNDCYQTMTKQIFIYRVPTIGFIDEPGLRCTPATVKFLNMSQADAPMDMWWDFGDGASSTERNPIHVYQKAGSYSVGLKAVTYDGCKDTLYLFKQDLISVHPNPISRFEITPHQTSICDANIRFIDQSVGATHHLYWFDDASIFSNKSNPEHTYRSSGTLYPKQTVSNEFGCKDSSFQTLLIEPFSIYVPNSFTPDGNTFNNNFNAVVGMAISKWELTVYNKWGAIVFKSSDPNIGWDGSYKEQSAPEGTYAYVITYVPCNSSEELELISGHINLLK